MKRGIIPHRWDHTVDYPFGGFMVMGLREVGRDREPGKARDKGRKENVLSQRCVARS